MQLVLILLRHGEAEEATATSQDHQRRLTARGQGQGQASGRQLADAAFIPSLVLVSDAARTQETWRAAVVGQPLLAVAEVTYRAVIYSGESADLGILIATQNAAKHAVLALVGHNPGISELASELAGRYLRLGTAEGVVLQAEAASWQAAVTRGSAWTLLAMLGQGALAG